ncbi:speckle targeted PIP5K1A-regulated poly(A) polymerase-like [Haliotis cracherodii]|uniref:speckle targeted PIP5K1A-regulated poly(A) polymerase-like n=1 Tax=Haliotis cracherodii TaxID=6455 RepID=UPI0039EB0FC1
MVLGVYHQGVVTPTCFLAIFRFFAPVLLICVYVFSHGYIFLKPGNMVIQCEYCMVTVPSEEAMKDHVKGKRHIRVIEACKLRQKQASLTVFTKGFSDDTTEDELRTYFSKFGKVEKIFMEYKRGLFAMVEYAEEESVTAAIAHTEHELKGDKIVVNPRKVNQTPRWVLKERKMKARQNARVKAAKENKKAIAVNKEELLLKLKSAESIVDQMRVLADFVRMTDEEITQKQGICDILSAALTKFFPACSVHQFGSSVNGFGVKGCDVDIYLDFHDDQEEAMHLPDSQAPVKLPYHRDIQSLKRTEGPLTSADLQLMTAYDKVKLVSRILVEHAPGCNNIIVIPSARCPLIKFTHEPSGIKCDLSINNKLALRNTRLLQLCSRIDERVGLLVYTVRYWAKVKEIAGNINSGPRLSNYALTFLVVQYLQNLATPILPTTSRLAELAGKEKVVIDGWDCSYLNEPETFTSSANTWSGEDLLKGFFEYYSNLDFSTVVLQTRTGHILPVQQMLEQPNTESQTFKIGPISIQDPFVLDHNIGGNVTEKIKQKISEEFQIAAKKCEKWSNVVAEEQLGLVDLLGVDVPAELEEELTRLRDLDEEKEDDHSFTVILKVAQLPAEAFKNPQTPDFRLNWCFKVCLFIQRVLETILMFETEVLAQTISGDVPTEKMEVDPESKIDNSQAKPTIKNTSPKNSSEQKSGTPSKGAAVMKEAMVAPGVKLGPGMASPGSPQSPSLHMELMCSSCCRTWSGRKTLRREVMEGELDGLELEREISEKIIESDGFSPKYVVQFRCDIDTVVKTSKTAVILKLEPTDEGKEFSCFYPFFKTLIRRLVDKNLYETW